jgi:hypothetical protein
MPVQNPDFRFLVHSPGGSRHLFPSACQEAARHGLRVTTHFTTGEDHTNVEENNRTAAFEWLRVQVRGGLPCSR